MSATETRVRTFPVIETFGPTIQGEGALAGLPTLFVRFGGCDYRCSWCDSLYAVLPEEVRENAVKMTAEDIVTECRKLVGGHGGGMWVTLSGGNPAMMNFDTKPMQFAFVAGLQRSGFKVSVETQGSLWKAWLADVDHLTVSPKPPSSGMATVEHERQTARFLDIAENETVLYNRSLKIVVFNDDDYDWARDLVLSRKGEWRTFLSVGTDQDLTQDDWATHDGIASRYRWLCEKVAVDPVFVNTRVMPQLHVIAWGTRRGV